MVRSGTYRKVKIISCPQFCFKCWSFKACVTLHPVDWLIAADIMSDWNTLFRVSNCNKFAWLFASKNGVIAILQNGGSQHDVISQKILNFFITAVRIKNLSRCIFFQRGHSSNYSVLRLPEIFILAVHYLLPSFPAVSETYSSSEWICPHCHESYFWGIL